MKNGGVTGINRRDAGAYVCSDVHSEFDLSLENYEEQLEALKSLKRGNTLTGSQRLVYIRRVPKEKCRLLHRYTEGTHGLIIFVGTQRLCDMDECIRSRASLINLAFEKEAVYGYCTEHIDPTITWESFERCYHLALGNIIGTVLRLECLPGGTLIDASIKELIRSLKAAKSFLSIVTNIREFVYKAFHLNIPFPQICRSVIDVTREDVGAPQVVAICATYEHMLSMTYKDLFVYEMFFLELRDTLKAKKPLKSNGT